MKFKLLNKINEADDAVITFIWEPERSLTWRAGQYIRYTLPHDNPDSRGTRRWFTIAAPPYELKPRITTRFDLGHGSSFKSKLNLLSIGDTIEAGDPEGDFLFDTSRPAVLIAGGIGITPFRAMILQLNDDNNDFRAHLLYGNHSEKFVFKEQLEDIAAKNSNLKLSYFSDPTRIGLKDIQKAGSDYVRPVYYLSGPEPMVEYYTTQIINSGISRDDIKTDDFPGYLWQITN
jgi:ferredoxin-NADP reductase